MLLAKSELDRDVSRVVAHWERERNVTIFISKNADAFYMSVFPVVPGDAGATDIYLCSTDENKYKLINAIRGYFRG